MSDDEETGQGMSVLVRRCGMNVFTSQQLLWGMVLRACSVVLNLRSFSSDIAFARSIESFVQEPLHFVPKHIIVSYTVSVSEAGVLFSLRGYRYVIPRILFDFLNILQQIDLVRLQPFGLLEELPRYE